MLPAGLPAVSGGWLVAWDGSLQHEAIHGHRTSRPWLNALIGGTPLALWLPDGVYRRTHLDHHRTPAITDPFDHPESRYPSGREGAGAALLGRLEAPLLGRMLLGPLFTVGRFLASEAGRARREPGVMLRDWMPHVAGVAAVLPWLRCCGCGIGAISCSASIRVSR